MTGARLVLRFGGTSLSTPLRVRSAADRIRFHIKEGAGVAAVVSAPSQESYRIARWLERVGGERTAGAAREIDRAAAAAEWIAASLLAASLAATGVPAVSFRPDEAGLAGDGDFGAGTLTSIESGRVRAALEQSTVAVVAGGQVQRADGEILMLRSKSADVIAVALAESLSAECHFIVDREGLDPVTWDGQLVHPAAAKRAEERNVTVKAYSFRSAYESVSRRQASS